MARKPFTPSEGIAVLRAYREHERAEAKKRQGERTDKHPGKLPESSTGRARDKLGAYLGKSARVRPKAGRYQSPAGTHNARSRNVYAGSGPVDRRGGLAEAIAQLRRRHPATGRACVWIKRGQARGYAMFLMPGILLMPVFVIAAAFWAFGPTWSWIPFNAVFWLLAVITFAAGPRRVTLMSPMSAQSTSGTFSLTLLLFIGVAAVLIFHERYWEMVLCAAVFLVSAFLWPRLRTLGPI